MKHDSAFEAATSNWHQAILDTDTRSSGNGLLSIFYGCIEQAARQQWPEKQLAIATADLEMLLTSYELKPLAPITDRTSEAVAIFIQSNLQDNWNEYDDMTHPQRQEIAINLVNEAASNIFGGTNQIAAASWLLFYLCPQLPVFPVIESLSTTDNYADYYLSQKQKFTIALPSLDQNTPDIRYGNQLEQSIIKALLTANNWWQRYLFVKG
ncbi:hypothetical protein [Aliamphritea ceti]|uniref:hypothetical protein n=1 Tax=Aliamphritea ceti TaxID=1524258 RepID=UPI0021C3DBC1|nr:hypothetical protein [Aliamphritea ceti]